MQLRFIKLLCVYEPETVCAYLSGNDGYPLEETLDLVGTKHNIMDAHAYLLERTGDKAGALNLILTSLTANAKIHRVIFAGQRIHDVRGPRLIRGRHIVGVYVRVAIKGKEPNGRS